MLRSLTSHILFTLLAFALSATGQRSLDLRRDDPFDKCLIADHGHPIEDEEAPPDKAPIPVHPWQRKRVENIRAETIEETLQNLGNFDDDHFAVTAAGRPHQRWHITSSSRMKIVIITATCLAAFALLSALVLLMLMAKRNRDRMAEWLCPGCGRPFGREAVAWPKGWYGEVRWLDRWSPSANGPVLRCTRCDKRYRFTHEGQIVGEQEAISQSG